MRDHDALAREIGAVFLKRVNDGLIGEPVKAVAAHLVSQQLSWQGDDARPVRERCVKRSVETGDLRGLGPSRARCSHARKTVWHVKRRKPHKLAQTGLDIFVNQARLGEIGAAMHEPMTYGPPAGVITAAGGRAERDLDRCCVIACRDVVGRSMARRVVHEQPSVRSADAFKAR
ncbi:MAG: hypothetical protein BroJett013_25050 [Alphaproteobacteria bacterium]|nr:MAG: hypothetical protein BroJett013_25050 [Alphaproteobacteria bacterium]